MFYLLDFYIESLYLDAHILMLPYYSQHQGRLLPS